jgi:phosphatidylserine/phosphatidylglycerophosphate/cardiolipin synthase-like enzyme
MWLDSFLHSRKGNKKHIKESYADLTNLFRQQWAAETGGKKFASETPGGGRNSGLNLPQLPALLPALPGAEGKQRDPEIASLPTVRQEAAAPCLKTIMQLTQGARHCPCHLPPGDLQPPTQPGRGGWQGSVRGMFPWDIPGKAG